MTGEVIDGFGRPLEGASVSVDGTTFRAVTDGAGRYSVGYAPGRVALEFSKAGYSPHRVSTEIATATTYPAEKVVLYKAPPADGVFLFGASDYQPLGQGSLTASSRNITVPFDDPQFEIKMVEGAHSEDIYQVSGVFTRVPAGKVRFVDSDSQNRRRLFRVADDGVVIRREYFIPTGLRDQARFVSEGLSQVAPGITIREVTLQPGRYAFVTAGDLLPDNAAGFGVRRRSFGRSAPVTGPVFLFEVGGAGAGGVGNQQTEGSPRAATTQQLQGNAESVYEDIPGTIGRYAIFFSVRTDRGRVTGKYRYKGKTESLRLEGSRAADGAYTLTEYAPDGRQSGTLVCRESAKDNEKTLEGTWASADGRRQLPFRLVPVKN
ncbi:MAG TPA: carboxypeptidase-like regulatory domain-containing protein [Blastocatellia bacterium]|nr:carboxypeptidase-like regulatory domain-containing protein [Blastocatellia bacterium]